MHGNSNIKKYKLFLVYFVNLYMFRAYLGPSSGGTTVRIQHLILIILFRYLFIRTTYSHLKRIRTKCCTHTVVPPDDGSRYARNMQRLMKYTKNQLCVKLVFLYTGNSYFHCQNPYIKTLRIIMKSRDIFLAEMIFLAFLQ